jgi:hypothetical protein
VFGFLKKFGRDGREAEEPKASLDGVDLDLERIAGAVELVEGFPRVHWDLVKKEAERYRLHPAIAQIWTELAAQWLGIIGKKLGEEYQISESRWLLLLSAQSAGEAKRFLGVGDEAYERLEEIVGRTEKERGRGKHAVIVLKTTAEYYDYISHFYPERDGEYGTSSAMHIGHGYRHTIVDGTSQTKLKTLVHELAHDVVAGRKLPRWLNEGFAQYAEEMVKTPGYEQQTLDERRVRIQGRYWSWFGIDRFWDGRAFLDRSSQRVSYELAKILFRNLATDRVRRRTVGTFLQTADRNDAGEAACRACFGCGLAQIIEEFLGEGDWEPAVRVEEPKSA